MTEPYRAVDNLEAMRGAERYTAFLVREILGAGSGASVCLDFGAGTGTFADALRGHGIECLCVEPDAALGQELQSRGYNCYASLDAVAARSVDFIFSLNVLEHIEDDVGTLRAIWTALRPGGCLYLYVPAFPVLFTSMDRKVGHFRRYTKRMLLPRLRGAGFGVSWARYADSLGFGATIVFKWFGNDRGDLNEGALAFYDKWVFPLSRALDGVVSGFIGKNLAVLAQKPEEGGDRPARHV